MDYPDLPLTNEPIPIPQRLSDLVRRRVYRLTPEVRRIGRGLVAASSGPSEELIRAACDNSESWTAIDQAVDEGIIERDGTALRFTHPLLRSVLYGEMKPNERRKVHKQLGATAEGTEERAWHLALGADGPSEETATLLDAAAKHAASRGAPGAAAALEEQASRLTPADQLASARKRTIYAADYHFWAGHLGRSKDLIEATLRGCPAGPLRASLLIKLATIHYHQSGWPLAGRTFREAVRLTPDDPALRAHAEQELAFARLVAGDLTGACRWAEASLRSAEQPADPRLTAHSMARIAAFTFLQGHDARFDLLDRADALDASARGESPRSFPPFSPSLVRGLVFKWCDELEEARLTLNDQYRQALERGDEASLPFLLYHLSELECWAGNWDAAEQYALEGCRVAEEGCQQAMIPATLYSLALVRAHRGHVEEARNLADDALAMCDRTGSVALGSQMLSVLGFVALSLDDYQTAHSHLGRLTETVTAVGLGQPSVVKFLPDKIETLAALGHRDAARSLAEQLRVQGAMLGRRWALATSARCRAHLAAIDGEVQEAQAACEEALAQHEQLSMPFELGRTLLTVGTIERRAKHRLAARDHLGQAIAVFERLGAPLWAAKARREMPKIAARAPALGLTSTEGRVAALISQGLTNKEVASAMFVTENTVQTHVRHIFQKLGVKSRTELAVRLLSSSASAAIAAKAAAEYDLQ